MVTFENHQYLYKQIKTFMLTHHRIKTLTTLISTNVHDVTYQLHYFCLSMYVEGDNLNGFVCLSVDLYERNSIYSFSLILLKRCRCFVHGLKMCMLFTQYRQFLF